MTSQHPRNITTYQKNRTLPLGVLLCALLLTNGCKKHLSKPGTKPNSTDYAAALQQISATPQLSILRWPNFTDVQPAVQAFYTNRDNQLAWTRSGTPTSQAMRLIQLFDDAANKGLNPDDYDGPRWTTRLQQLDQIYKSHDDSDKAGQTIAAFDAAVTIAALRYVDDLHLGRVNPQTLNFDIDVPAKRAAFDAATLLNDKLVDGDDIPAALTEIEPQNPIYKQTEALLPHYIELAKREDANPIQPLPALATGAKSIAVGTPYDSVAALFARLQREGDANGLDANAAVAAKVYSQEVSDAVKKFQARHALDPDGKLGQATIDALNLPMSVNVQKLNDALERWRWLPDNYMQPRVMVNLPEFLLRAFDADHGLAFTMRVVDGETKGHHDTPMFVRLMRYVVFRPYWNLPPSIVKKEIMPHIARSGLGYLESHGYEAYKSDGTVVTGYTAADIQHARYSVRQKPGPKNSLGLVKFLFPNEYDVYMHSTPELNLFGLARRDKSHGCVRLQHADQMAVWVLNGNAGEWDADRVNAAMTGDDNNKTYNLKTPLPVIITYLTALGEADGSAHFFHDMYGYDKQLEAALAKGRPYAQGPAKINPTLTPGETE